MKKVYWAGGKNSDPGGWYSMIDDTLCTELEKKNAIKQQEHYYICLDSKRFRDIAAGALDDDEAREITEKNDTGLYSNPGKTIKSIAKTIFIIGCIGFFVIGIYVGNLGWDFNTALFLAIVISGILISYITGLGLAALGDLVMNTNEINRKLK